MTSYRIFVPGLLLAMMLVQTTESSVYAQGPIGPVVLGEPKYDWLEYIRVQGSIPGNFNNYAVYVSKPTVAGIVPELGRLFYNDENCGNVDHRTKYNYGGVLNADCDSRCFKHYHIDFSYPLNGPARDVDTNFLILSPVVLVSIAVTEANVEAFWHYYFLPPRRPNYTYLGGVNPKVNCWGYAFGFSTWVEDPARIYENDYPEHSYPWGPSPWYVAPGDLAEYSGHAIKVTEVDGYPMGAPGWYPGLKMVSQTRERNRSSGIYEVNCTYLDADRLGPSFRVKK